MFDKIVQNIPHLKPHNTKYKVHTLYFVVISSISSISCVELYPTKVNLNTTVTHCTLHESKHPTNISNDNILYHKYQM